MEKGRHDGIDKEKAKKIRKQITLSFGIPISVFFRESSFYKI
jgi:hypothetical protein